MTLSDDLYREVILEHFKEPRNYGSLDNPDIAVTGANPLCGDEIELTIVLDGAKIKDIKTTGKGCSISTASSSMMTEALKGKDINEVIKLARAFKDMLLVTKPEPFPEPLEECEALESVKNYPVRIKCALLAWNTLLEGIAKHDHKTV